MLSEIEIKKYSFPQGLKKGFISVLIFSLPFLITNFPDIANLTIGGVLAILVNWLKIKYVK